VGKRNILIVTAVLLGLVIGAAASSSTSTQEHCERTELVIKEESNLSGALACFPPGVIEYDASERIEEGSELECVCRHSLEGNVRLFAINRANP
jgi:hypothetical protein